MHVTKMDCRIFNQICLNYLFNCSYVKENKMTIFSILHLVSFVEKKIFKGKIIANI